MIAPETPPLTESELAELPVFPLPNAVLFPGVSMGLHLFEPRYRAMMRHCLEHGPRAIAIAHLLPGFDKEYEGQPAIYEVAGAGRIISHRGNPDGTFDLILEGTQRVLLHELPFVAPFRRARAVAIADRCDDEVAMKRVIASLGLKELMAQMARDSRVPIAPAQPLGPAGRIIDVVIDQLVHDPAQRQRLLEMAEVDQRVLTVNEMMRGGRDADARRMN